MADKKISELPLASSLDGTESFVVVKDSGNERVRLSDILSYVLDSFGYGSESLSPDANGNGTIAHGLGLTPAVALVGIRGDNANGVDVESVDGTDITVRIKDAAGADVTAGTFTVDWFARGT